MTRAQLLGIAERVGAAAATAGIGVALTYLSDIPAWWAVAAIPVLEAARSWLTTRVTGSASLVRPKTEPAVTPPAS